MVNLQAPDSRYLVDPPDLAQHAERGEPPIEKWPGRVIDRTDLMRAYGDPRDWFRYGHRLQAFEQIWEEWIDARRRRRDFMAGFDWEQILIIGEYGASKTTLAILHALPWIRTGHPLFAVASTLWGWRLPRELAYVAMLFMPPNGIQIHDEASASHSARMGPHVAVSSGSETNLNTRKRNAKQIYASAHDWEIAASIRMECKQVWMPVKKDDLVVEAGAPGGGESGWTRQADNPANFRIAWHVWDDYPYKKRNLIEGKKGISDDGFGPPDFTMYDEGENVRLAFLLNDTFAPAMAGAATLADRDTVKGYLESFHQGGGPTSAEQMTPEDQNLTKLMAFLESYEDNPPEYFMPGEIAGELGVDPAVAGKLVARVFQVRNVQRKGYPSEPIYRKLEQLMWEE